MGENGKQHHTSKGVVEVLFFVINILLFCFAVVAIAIGAWVRADEMTPYISPHFSDELWRLGDDHSQPYRMTATVLQLKAFSMIIEGCIVIVLLLMARVGLQTDVRAAAGAYMISFMVTAGLTIMLFVKGIPSQWSPNLYADLKNELQSHYNGLYVDSNDEFTTAFDGLQITEHCCGLNDYKDYSTFNMSLWELWPENSGHLVPLACCVPKSEPITIFWMGNFNNATLCMNKTEADYTWRHGCIDILKERMILYFAVMAGISCAGLIIQIFSIVVVMLMCCS